jgi:LuxR family transcriptional regulator, maltose regulon positive regulatory protein
VLLAEQKPAAALGLLQRWRTMAVGQGRGAGVLRWRVLAALAHDSAGDRPAALAALADGLVLAAPEGYLRVFLDEGAPIATLLHELATERRLEQLGADRVPRQFLDRLTDAVERRSAPDPPSASRGAVTVPGMRQPLSNREHEVLQLLAAGHPNKAIAGRLFITVDTVKRHVSHVFDKIGATNRTQAVARARELGLLDHE